MLEERPEQDASPAPRSGLAFVLRLVLSLGVVAVLIAHVDAGQLVARLGHVDPVALSCGLLALLGSAVAAGVVWSSVFPRERRLASVDAIRFTLIGFSINNLVPMGMAGDVYRVWAAARSGAGWVLACYSVLMDRWCAFLVLLLALAGAAAYLRGRAPDGGAGALHALLAIVLVLAIGFAVATVALLLWRGRLPGFLRTSQPDVERVLPEICAHMRAHVLSSRVAVTLLWAVVSVWLEALCILFVARSLGVQGSPLAFMILAPVFRVMHRVPGFVNAIGPQEVAALAVWGVLGVPRETALSISFLLHALRAAVGLVGVPLYLAGGAAGRPGRPGGRGGPARSE